MKGAHYIDDVTSELVIGLVYPIRLNRTVVGYTTGFWPTDARQWHWPAHRPRWIACHEFYFTPKYLRVDIPGASLDTLRRRIKYRGGRKANRAARRIRSWTHHAYHSDVLGALVMGGLAATGLWAYLLAR